MANGESATQRWVEVGPERIGGWLESFAVRHGGASYQPGPDIVSVLAADGAVAECLPPFPPLPAGSAGTGAELAAHALADRTVAVLLVRLGGYAAGIFAGSDARLVASKVGSRLVHGRSAAGGQSQQRFARRRENQAHQAITAAADTAAAVFGPYKLDALVLGGDKRAFSSIRTDPRLTPFFEVAVESFLTVPDPRLTVLKDTPRLFRAIRIKLTQPAD